MSLLNRLTSHFPSGEMAFNSYTSFAVWASKHVPGTESVAGLLKFPGVDDPRELERWNPKLKLIREILLTREPEIAEYPTAVRLYNRLLATSTTLSPQGDRRILAVSATRWSSTLTDFGVSLVGGGRWYGPAFPRLKGAARPFATGLRPALDPRGPPALAGRNGG